MLQSIFILQVENRGGMGYQVYMKLCMAQCGNYRIFLSLRFYVKSKLTNSVSKSVVLTHLDGLKFDFYEFLHFQNSCLPKW